MTECPAFLSFLPASPTVQEKQIRTLAKVNGLDAMSMDKVRTTAELGRAGVVNDINQEVALTIFLVQRWYLFLAEAFSYHFCLKVVHTWRAAQTKPCKSGEIITLRIIGPSKPHSRGLDPQNSHF